MTEKEQMMKDHQLKMLQEVFDKWIPPTPAFKPNHEGVPKDTVPYISASDVHDYKYNIRVISSDVFFSNDDNNYEKLENGEIIAHYDSLEELVEDGWKLD